MKTSTTDRLLQIGIVLTVAILIVVVADTLREHGTGVGDTAPDFTIRTDSGITVSRGDFGGKILVLNFWATWCPPCLEEMPSLDEFQKLFQDDGVVVLGVSVDEDEAAYRALVEKEKFQFLTARDPSAKLSADFGTFRYPESYIIDGNGKVLQKIVGATVWTDQRMVGYIRSLL